MAEAIARWLGIDVTTTEMAVAVSDGERREGFASTKMRGATHWHGNSAFPAFDLRLVPGMLTELLENLMDQGWTFEKPGSLSIACRQHDLALLDPQDSPLIAALSWQCNAAVSETERLNANSQVTNAVGPLEARFILPKLAHVLSMDESLRDQTSAAMTTGDWILGSLTGRFRLSSSDALSNGLLDQETRALAADVLSLAGIPPEWFPEVIQSGHTVGTVGAQPVHPDWQPVSQTLTGWQAVAGLGDNHASALGCGMIDERTLVVSAGTSGTINLATPANSPLNEVDSPAVRFEFYRRRNLLLRMLAYCGDWYNRFLAEFGGDFSDAHPLLNSLAADTDMDQVVRVECDSGGEFYRPGWTQASLACKTASVQFSIGLELLIHVGKMLAEVPDSRQQISRYVLTGGLSQSTLFQQVFHAGIELLDGGKEIMVSGRIGPLRYKTSAYGALLNARMPEFEHEPANIPSGLFPVAECTGAGSKNRDVLRRRIETEFRISGMLVEDYGDGFLVAGFDVDL